MKRHSGFTLIEMLVALAVLATASSVVAVAWGARHPPARPAWASILAEARRRALVEGRAVTVVIAIDSAGPQPITFLSDGRRLAAGVAEPALVARAPR